VKGDIALKGTGVLAVGVQSHHLGWAPSGHHDITVHVGKMLWQGVAV